MVVVEEDAEDAGEGEEGVGAEEADVVTSETISAPPDTITIWPERRDRIPPD